MYLFLKESQGHHINKPVGDKETLIIVRYYISKIEGKFVYSTGKKIKPSDWDFNSKKVKRKRGRTDLTALALEIDKYSNYLDVIKENYSINEINITRKILKTDFDKKFKKTPNEHIVLSVYDYYDQMVAEKSKANKLSKESLKKYKSIKNKLIKYEKFTGKKLTFKSFGNDFFDDYLNFARNELNQLDNTISRQLGYLRTFLKWASKKGLHKHEYSHIKISSKETDDIALTKKEVFDIYNFHFDNESYSKVIDVFLIGCLTGQRFSDYSVFDKIDYNNGMIEKRAQKTKAKSIIPVDSNIMLKKLLDKYDWKLPKISNQKFNVILRKALSKIESLDYKIKKMSFQGTKTKVEILKKWQMCSSHTARRTFISVCLEDGWTYKEVMAVAGIKDVNTLMRYDKINHDRLNVKVNGTWTQPTN